jgi:hypothetical protein
MFTQIDIDFLPKYKIDYLVSKTTNLKYKCAILLMCDCGLRVSEMVNLKLSNFDFKERLLGIESLKKREKAKFKKRVIPLSQRIYNALVNYIPTLKNKNSDDYIFPNMENTGHITRDSINKYLDRFKAKNQGFDNLHPHALRHSYATYLMAQGQPTDVIQRLLGHENKDTTAIYTHIPTENLKRIHSEVFDTKRTRLEKLKDRIFGKPKDDYINIEPIQNELMIGRDDIIHLINDRVQRNINTIILGDTGTGKTTLLKNINPSQRKVLLMDDVTELKATLLNTLVYLHESKEEVFALLMDDYDKTKIKTKLSRQNMKNLAHLICDVVQPQEYILIIDSVDRIPPRAVEVLEIFKDTFTIVTSARSVALNKSSFLWNFEVINLQNLERPKAMDMISKLSHNIEVEDWEQYKNYIWNKSDGNPRVIFEMIDRFRKEPVLTKDIVSSIDHYGSLKEYDMSIFILIGFGCMAIFRYVGKETGDSSLTFIGGCGMILMILSRYLFNFTKQKVIKS